MSQRGPAGDVFKYLTIQQGNVRRKRIHAEAHLPRVFQPPGRARACPAGVHLALYAVSLAVHLAGPTPAVFCFPAGLGVFLFSAQFCSFVIFLYLIFLYFFAGVVPAVPHPSCQPPDCKSLYPHPGPWPPAMDHAQHNTQLRWMGKRMLKRRVHTAA